MRGRILGLAAVLFYRALVFTWRIEVRETTALQQQLKAQESFAVAHWHGDELGILFLLRRYHIACMISQSEDGSIMAQAARLLGAEVVRGSSSRGATAGLKALIRATRRGRRPSLAVDGPKGPIYKVKPGIFEISRLLSLPIHPISVACDRSWKFEKSWNKTFLPKPFARVVVQWGEPLPAVAKTEDPRSAELAQRLEDRLFDAKGQALGHT